MLRRSMVVEHRRVLPGVGAHVEAISKSSGEATPQAVVALLPEEWRGPSAEAIVEELCHAPQPGEPRLFLSRLFAADHEFQVTTVPHQC